MPVADERVGWPRSLEGRPHIETSDKFKPLAGVLAASQLKVPREQVLVGVSSRRGGRVGDINQPVVLARRIERAADLCSVHIKDADSLATIFADRGDYSVEGVLPTGRVHSRMGRGIGSIGREAGRVESVGADCSSNGSALIHRYTPRDQSVQSRNLLQPAMRSVPC
jgi:hypothetical protein